MARPKKVPKDPARDRLVFEVLHALEGHSAKSIAEKIRRSAGKGGRTVHPQTILNWRKSGGAGTRYPHAATLAAAGRIAGLDLRFVRSNHLRNLLED